MYFVLNRKSVNYLIKNIFLLEKNMIDKKQLFLVFSSFLCIFFLFFGLWKVRNHYYNQEIDALTKKRNYKLEIVDKTTTCREGLEEFYKDELYIYYFPCQKKDTVYAKINDGEEYLVYDLLNHNPTEYVISIRNFEFAGLVL